MEEQMALELIIDSRDENTIRQIEGSLASVKPVRGRKARPIDPITILGIAAASVKLVNELLALKKNLQDRKDAAKVTVRNLTGETVGLDSATEEDLKKLLQ
jgi:hypothetical protein